MKTCLRFLLIIGIGIGIGRRMSNEGIVVVGIEYWLQWQVLVCGLIVFIPLVMASLIIDWSKQQEHLSIRPPSALWLPRWRNLHPLWLLLYRVFAFVFMAYLLYLTVHSFGVNAFFFYTQWTFALVTLYLALGSVISARGCWMYSRYPVAQSEERDKFVDKSQGNTHEADKADEQAHFHQYLLQRSSVFLETSMFVVYQICAGAVVLTDIIFWCVLVPFVMRDSFKLTLLIGCMHSVNAVVLVLDSAFVSLPLNWYGLTYLVFWSCSYVVFQWVLHACCITWWPYPFLELSTPWAPLWYLGLALVHIPCYGLYMLLVNAKNSIFSRMFPRAFIRWY